jgi:SNF2-related domain/SNF2 Helicase protein/Helicase conserved C-terminal domain
MLAIHGIWADGALLLWAEDATRPAPEPAGRPGPAEARPHPGAASLAALAAALAGLPGEAAELAWSGAEGELVLWLPGTAAGPQPSPELAAAHGEGTWLAAVRGGGRVVLRAWRVPVLCYPAPAALPLLAGLGDYAEAGRLAGAGSGDALLPIGPDGELAGSGDTPDEVIFGQSVPYLAACAALADDLAARGRLLPALTRLTAPEAAPGSYAARWRPVVSGADAQRVRELAQAMPPVCRATSEAGQPGAAVLASLLDALTDAAARASLATDPAIDLLPPRRGRRPAKVSVTERWAAALTSTDPAFEVSGPADEDEAAVLAADLAAWHAAAQVPPGPVRTCFRLIEPPLDDPGTGAASGSAGTIGADEVIGSDEASGVDKAGVIGGEVTGRRDWAVEFALQSADDPSLVLPASDIWDGAVSGWGGGPGSTGPGIGYPEEELLTGLGRASRLFPELDAELRTAAPAAVSLDTAGAWKFVREAGPLLSGAGFGVLLPDWARQRRLGLRISARSTPAAPGSTATGKPMFGLADMVSFRYELALGDVPLDPAELEELARLKVPLVRLRGQWVELTQDQLKAAVRFMEQRGAQAGQMRAGDLLSAGLHGTGDDLPVTGISADGWLGDLLASRDGQRLEPARTPDSFRGQLRPYQERGLAWLSFLGSLGLGGVLADDMGLGKTIQLLALLAREQDEHAAQPGSDDLPGPGPSLLICPMSVVGNWEREAAQFTPQLGVHTHHGAGRLTGEELSAAVAAADLVITSYGVATRDREALRQVTWHRVICDEAQNIKNAATRQAQAVRSLPAVSRIALTGTPVENRLADLWSIMEFTSPGLLGPAEKFRKQYSVPIERNGDEAATERLKLVTGPFILRRLKTDRSIIADLPDKLEMKVWCNLTPEQASLYQATVTDMLARIEAAEGIERRGLVLATMAKLKQVCNHPAHLLGDGSRLPGRSGKLARLEEICDEVVAGGEKALCFTQYAEFGRMLQPHLAARLGCPVFWLHGGTPKKQRDAMVDRFSRGTQPAVFLLSLKAGGTGLNLTAANHVIHVDRWWNPAVEDQATDRAFRIGQRRNVQVRKFVCVGTVEEKIDAMIEEKKALAERIVGTGESWLTELSVADLRKVVALGPEAVSA